MRYIVSMLLVLSLGVLSGCAGIVDTPAPSAPTATVPEVPSPAEDTSGEATDATPEAETDSQAQDDESAAETSEAEATPETPEEATEEATEEDTEENTDTDSDEETADQESADQEGEEEQNAAGEDDPATGVVEQEGTVQEPLELTNAIGLQLVAEGLSAPVYLTTPPQGNGALFIVDQAGQIYVVDESGEQLEEPFLDLTDQIVELRDTFDERGLLGLAFHPEYEGNGRFFVYYSAPLRDEAPDDWNHTGYISEFSVSEDDPYRADPDSERVLMEIDQPQFNHNGGTLVFGPEGYLYISLGDGGDADDTGLGHPDIGNGQDVTTLLGAILRIHVDGEEPYEIPFDNPFIEADSEENGNNSENGTIEGRGEIFAYGLRNPYRITWDMDGEGTLYAADVGQHLFEEVNIITKGGNYGWNIKEGTHCFSPESPFEPPEDCPDTGAHDAELIDPVIEYVNIKAEGGLGTSIIAGYIYRGTALSDFEGDYIFGDYSRQGSTPGGRLFASTPEEGNGLWSMREIPIANASEEQLGHFLLGFGRDHEGELYILVSQSTAPVGDTGRVFKLVAADEGSDLAGMTTTGQEATGEEVTEEEATDEEATDEEATDEEATDEEVTDEEATAEEAAADEEAAAEVTIDLVAENINFDRDTITVPAGARVVIEFTNLDTVEHNFSLYESEDRAENIFRGDLIGGPDETITYEFDAPDEPGSYFFICDPHPVEMTGEFIVE